MSNPLDPEVMSPAERLEEAACRTKTLAGSCRDCPSDVGSIPTASTTTARWNSLSTLSGALGSGRLLACPGVSSGVVGVCVSRADRTSDPPESPLSPPRWAFRRLCLCFHETCANQSDTEKTRRLLAFLRVGSEFVLRSARRRESYSGSNRVQMCMRFGVSILGTLA